ncbi:hypothetical protein H257_09101 [Aphanomyces astaci]|uniref:HTH CENPB-type domain-containing protein n=1 Tax=Aphanomyces astaci TaxID=112090 RepID=W4GDS1_APHAT|nr:hypothetical protein H257_09101 [Aphanomyces astaci]ETV77214.1 hypothetical protein H257_09101 [Aphanomyces astaci]|eukprot:XP_009833520.1 hypothetical protein H257_09101 [Aphanomyces astaci]
MAPTELDGRRTGRPSTKQIKGMPKKHKNLYHTYEKKLHIINWRKEHSMESAIDTFFAGVAGDKRTTARTRDMRTLRKQGISTTLTRVAEENIAQWVSELREDGIPVSKTLLACKAMDAALEQGLAVNQFKASPSWMKGFMKRWGLAIRAKTRSGQANLADGEKALAEFKTSIQKGSKTVWIKASGHEKDRVTAMLLADSKGTKYPPFLVLKSKASTIKEVVQENLTQRHGFGRQVWKEIEDLEANFPLQIYGNPSAWWNAGISLRFLDFHFGHRRGQAVDPVLLLWDDFSAHFTDEVVQRAKDLQASGHDKDRVTAMLLADSKGTKYPPFLVLKSKASTIKEVVQENLTQRHGFGRQVWKEIEDLEANFPLQIYGNPSAWWNAGISLRFLDFHFGHRRGQAVDPVLLLWDDFSAHFTDEVVERAKDLQVYLYRVPPTFTWICQPGDVAWMKPIKASMRRKWVDYLQRSIELNGRGGGRALRLKCPERWDIVEWISDVWDELPTTTIVKGFEKCQIIDPGTDLVDNTQQDPEDSSGDDVLQDLCDTGVFEVLDPEDDVSLTWMECID